MVDDDEEEEPDDDREDDGDDDRRGLSHWKKGEPPTASPSMAAQVRGPMDPEDHRSTTLVIYSHCKSKCALALLILGVWWRRWERGGVASSSNNNNKAAASLMSRRGCHGPEENEGRSVQWPPVRCHIYARVQRFSL